MRRKRFEYPKPSFVHGRPVREHLISAALDFVENISEMQGVERVALIGSICTPKPNPKDVDVLVTIAPSVDMEKLATLGRKLKGRGQNINCGADIFLADSNHRYLGRTCSWKECRPGVRMRCEALHCGTYLYDDLQCLKLDRELIANPKIILHPRIIVRGELPEDLMNEVKKRFGSQINRTSFRGHFSSAVLTLATHRGGIKERLVFVGLELAKISGEEYDLLPGGLGKDLEKFMDRLKTHGPIPESVKALTEEEAEVLAHDFWGLWENLQSIPADALVSCASDIASKRK